MRFLLTAAIVVSLAFLGTNAQEVVTRGRHGDGVTFTPEPVHHQTDAPHTEAPHTDAPHTEPPVTHHQDPITHHEQPTTETHHHVDPVTNAPVVTNPPVTNPPVKHEVSAVITENGKHYEVTCDHEGSMRHPANEHKYIICEYLADHLHWTVTVMPCAIGTKWDDAAHNCVLDI